MQQRQKQNVGDSVSGDYTNFEANRLETKKKVVCVEQADLSFLPFVAQHNVPLRCQQQNLVTFTSTLPPLLPSTPGLAC